MKTCRICLKFGVKMFKLGNTVHREFIESIVKLQGFSYVLSENHYACYICTALLKKFYNFTQMVVNAHKVLCDLLIANEELTTPMLMNINRHEKGLDLISLSCVSDSQLNEILYHRIVKNSIQSSKQSHMMPESQLGSYEVEADNNSLKDEVCIKMRDENVEEPFEDNFNVDEVKKYILDPLVEGVKTSEETSTYTEIPICAESELMKSFIEANDQESEVICKIEHLNSSGIESPNTNDDNQTETTSLCGDLDFDPYDYKENPKKKSKVHHRKYPRKCDHCNYRVQRAADHYRHYQYTHPDAEYPYGAKEAYACSICGQIYSVKRIKDHELSHKTNMKIQCALCPKICETRKKLHAHRSRAHPKTTLTCDYCSKVFKTRTDITRHIRIHTGEKPFKCHICGAGFAHSGNRKIHIRSSHQNYTPKGQKQTQNVKGNTKYSYFDTEIESNDAIHENICNIQEGNGHTNTQMKSEKRTQKTRKNLRKVRNSSNGDNTRLEHKKRTSKRTKKTRNMDDNMITELDSIWNH